MRVWPVLGGALVRGFWALINWEVVLRYAYGESTEVYDPILGQDTGFYLFTLPFYDALYWGLIGMVGISLLAACLSEYTKLNSGELDEPDATFYRWSWHGESTSIGTTCFTRNGAWSRARAG